MSIVDTHIKMVISDPATGEWLLYTWEWRKPFRADSLSAAIKLAEEHYADEKPKTWDVWQQNNFRTRVTAKTIDEAVRITNPERLNLQYIEVTE